MLSSETHTSLGPTHQPLFRRPPCELIFISVTSYMENYHPIEADKEIGPKGHSGVDFTQPPS